MRRTEPPLDRMIAGRKFQGAQQVIGTDIQEINERLEDAIADENYEYAKMYKDELRRREEEEDTNK